LGAAGRTGHAFLPLEWSDEMTIQRTSNPRIGRQPRGHGDVAPGAKRHGILAWAWREYRDWRRRRNAIRHLLDVDEYLLRDIGIEWWEIQSAVSGSLKQDSAEPVTVLEPRRAPGGNDVEQGGRRAA
jgi:uncharacterized protein YjiS (DUF1127 family)